MRPVPVAVDVAIRRGEQHLQRHRADPEPEELLLTSFRDAVVEQVERARLSDQRVAGVITDVPERALAIRDEPRR